MNYKEFEKSVKEKLSEHEAQIDTNALVSAIFEKQGKVKRFPAWWGYGGALAVLSVVSFLIFYYSGRPDSSLKDMAVKTQATAPDRSDLSYDEVYDRTPEGTIRKEAGSVVDNKETVMANAAKSDIQPGVVSFSHDKNIYSNIKVRRDSRQVSTIKASGVDDSKLPDTNEFITRQKSNTIGLQSTAVASDNKVVKGVAGIDFLNSKTTGLNSVFNASINLGPSVKCPTFRPKRRVGFALIPEVGVFYPLANFKNEAGPESQPFAMRENKERSLEGLQAALYGKLYLSNSPWYFKTGVNYGRITRQMTYNDTYIQRDTTIGIIAITESQNHDTLTIIKGPIVTETTISKYEKRHYYHHLLSIPVVIGFQKKFDWIHFGIEAGVNINLISDQTGYVMVTPNQFGLVRDANLYRKRTGLSYLASIQVGVPLYNDNILALAVRANINPNNFALDNVPFNEKYQMLGVHLMYEIRF